MISINKIVGTNPVLVLGTKIDLLGSEWKPNRLRDWLHERVKEFSYVIKIII
jgi:hypothetical protein